MAKMKTTSRGSQQVEVAPGLVVVGSSVEVKIPDWQGYDLELVVVPVPMSADGRAGGLVCREVRVLQREGGPAVTGEALRSVPVAQLTKHAGHYVTPVERAETHVPGFNLTDQEIESIQAEGPTDRALKLVAGLYRLALVTREPPTKFVEDALGLPRSTTGRWVALARESGFLGAAEGPGKAGG